jgi:signal transduction histidine kinase
MIKKLIPVLGVATAIAAFFLIAFQLFWINEAKKIKEDEFNNVVNSAMDQLISNMEKSEVHFQIVNDISSPRQGYFMNSKTGIRSLQKQQQLFTINLRDSLSIMKRFLPVSDPAAVSALYKTLQEVDKTEREMQPKNEGVQLDEKKISYKKVLVDNIVEKIITVEVPIEQRISAAKIDLLIAREFKMRGLNLEYKYVVRHENGEALFGADNVKTSGRDVYIRQLFPSDLLSERYYLAVTFPYKQSYIYKAMGATLLASLALLAIVLGVFFGTLSAILRQKKLSQIRNDFASNMTHELKTPIATISLAAQMLNDPNVPNEKKNYDYLSSMIMAQSKQLSFLVERVLQLAMFESGRLRLRERRVDFHQLAGKVLDGFALRAQAKGASMARAFNARECTILVDEVHFSNIFGNLIDNALKYGKDDPIIVVSTRNTEDGKLLIQVRDNGIGMSKEDVRRVFEQFYRAHTGNLHNVKGFGLGLSYVKKIVEAHNGEIWIDSELGKGSTFNILMPIVAKKSGG